MYVPSQLIEDFLKFKSESGENYQYIAVFILLLRPTRKASPLSFKFMINLTETSRCVFYLPQFERSHFGVEQVLGHPCMSVYFFSYYFHTPLKIELKKSAPKHPKRLKRFWKPCIFAALCLSTPY